jgi:hypothetical protein
VATSSQRVVYILKNSENPPRYYTGVTSDLERHRLPPIASSRARQAVPPTIALEDFVQIAFDRLAHVGW